MTLTFRSTIPETRTIIQQEADGRRRVAVATRDLGSTARWDLRVTHPSGENWNGTFNGDGAHVVIALGEMLNRTANDFAVDKARGDRPKPPAADHNRRVEGFAPIRPIPGR
jgi:hypothetical protein